MSKRKIWNTESGLNKLDIYFTKPADRTVFGRLASALHRNIQEEHLYGSTSTIRDERIAIVRHLNEFSLNILNVSFNSLCLIEIDRDTQGVSYEARLNRWRELLPFDDRTTILDFLTLEYQLWVNVTNEFLYGNTDALQQERTRLLKLLNEVVHTHTKQQYPIPSLENNSSSTPNSASTSHSTTSANTSRKEASNESISRFNYASGISALEAHLTDPEGRDRHSRLAEALHSNLRKEISQGTTEEIRNERFRLIYALNELALEFTGRSFNDWCFSSDNPATNE